MSQIRPLSAFAGLVLAFAAFAPAPAGASGIDSTKISLPKGPGSVEGLASADFTPSLASGNASYSVGIAVPPASGGFGPDLALSYDSGGGASEIGIGWRVSGPPRIRRRTEEGLPRFDETDTFELVGLGVPCELLEVESGTFRPRFEDGSFVRVKRSADGSMWEARTKGGVTFRFGAPGDVEGRFAEAEGEDVSAYLLAEQIDTHGRRIAYEWDTGEGHALLTRVTWNDFDASSRNEVALEYEERPDHHVRFSSGIRQEITRRLGRIGVWHGGVLVRRYELGYGAGIHPTLTSVTLAGRDGTSRMPAARFGYTEAKLENDISSLVTMSRAPGRSPRAPDTTLADVNGDGLPDLLVGEAGAYRYYPNHDGRAWLAPVDFESSASPSASLSTVGVQVADLDADGAPDVVVRSAGSARYFPSPSRYGFGPAVPLASVPSFTFEDPDVRLADLDGDRRTDVVVTTLAGLAIGYNREGRDIEEPSLVGIIDEHEQLRFSNGRTDLCDVNGDRVMDLCVLRPRAASLAYYLGRGRGTFEPPVTASGVPTSDETNPYQLSDLNGDGWIDLVRLGKTAVSYALAEGVGRFGAETTLTGTPEWTDGTTTELVDINASGTTDLVWVNVTGEGLVSWRYLELFPDGRAGLLTLIENGLGKVQSIEYEPAAAHAARARDEGAPWTTRLNVPLPVVSRITVDSSLGDPLLETRFRYRNGAYDPRGRTFAGFAAGVTEQVGDSFTPTLLTERTFDLGLDDRVLRGVPLTEESRDAAGSVFFRTSRDYTRRTVATSLDGRAVELSFASAVTTTHIERDDAASRVTRVESEQDHFGNVVEERRWGEVADGDVLVGRDETIVRRTFANDPGEWLLGFVATEETLDAAGNRVALARRHYDGDAFVGLPLGKVLRGALTREEAWVGPGPDVFELVTATRYDAHGLPVETKDGRGGGRFFTWASDHTTLLSEAVKLQPDEAGEPVELVEIAETDPAFGSLLSVIEYNGQRTRFGYDPFGRLTSVVKAGDTVELPTVSYRYEVGNPLTRIVTESRRISGEAAVDVSEKLQDGLGRERGTLTHDGEPAGSRFVLAGVALLDARGNPRRALVPRFVDAAGHASPPLLVDGAQVRGTDTWRDAAGREIRTRSAGGIESRTAYLPLEKHHWDGGQSDPASLYAKTPIIERTDGQGRVVAHIRSLNGRELTSVQTYDPRGVLLSRTDPEGNVARYENDGRGRRIAVHDPDAGSTRFTYDATGNVTGRTYPDGVTVRFTFDLGGRPLAEDWNDDGAPEIAHTYDVCESGAADALCRGKLVRTFEPSGTVGHDYDARGRVTATHYTIDGALYTVQSEYDAQDRERLHVYPDGSSIAIQRNPRGQIAGYGAGAGTGALAFDHDEDGLETARRFATGVTLATGYDADRRRSELAVTSATGGILESLRWKYDSAGNLTQLEDRRPGVAASESRTEVYQYDDLYRLTRATGTWGVTSWAFSSSGNLVGRESTVSGQSLRSVVYADRPHAPVSFDGRIVAYDARGRMLTDGARTYEWNEADQLARVTATDGASVASRYGHEGVRRARTETRPDGTKTTTHFIDAWTESRDGVLTRYIVHGGQRIVRLAPETGVQVLASGVAPQAPASTALLLVLLAALCITFWIPRRPAPASALSPPCAPFVPCETACSSRDIPLVVALRGCRAGGTTRRG